MWRLVGLMIVVVAENDVGVVELSPEYWELG